MVNCLVGKGGFGTGVTNWFWERDEVMDIGQGGE